MSNSFNKLVYKALERGEIDRTEDNLTDEQIEYVSAAVSLFGYVLSPHYNKTTFVVHTKEIEAELSGYELSALDILCSIAKSTGGLPYSQLEHCPVANSLLLNGWIQLVGPLVKLSKRTQIEKAQVLSEYTGIEICSFCHILNEEGNIPHTECTPFIN
ncbi:hypothetical protein NEOKW01_1497 [Nematocida sp. AWRm80]|nr:hypothetical protein NEOKW01_1497 [Nematocida sp. AWRm80]